jgi:protein Mpv17
MQQLDQKAVLRFIAFTLLTCPPNILWQAWLERAFPGQGRLARAGKTAQSSTGNTARKFLLDQTVGACINTIFLCVWSCSLANEAFDSCGRSLVIMSWLKGAPNREIQQKVRTEFWPLLKASYSVWPIVSLLSFTVVPAENRILFGSAIGLLWNVFLSMRA